MQRAPLTDLEDAKILEAYRKGRLQKLTKDDLFQYVYTSLRKRHPEMTWREARVHVAAMRARRVLKRKVYSEIRESDKLYDVDKPEPQITATEAGILIPWAILEKFKA